MTTDNTSAYAGTLQPTGAPVLYDDELVDQMQPLFVALSGVPGSMFRPRFQIDDQPNMPEQGETWASLGVRDTRTDTFAYTQHVDNGNGYDFLQRSEEIDFLISFYGPRAKTIAELLRDNFSVEQNRAPLDDLKMGLVSVGSAIALPSILASKWQRRVDVTVTIRRCVERNYGVLTIIETPNDPRDGAELGLDNELYLTPLIINGDTP